jgi:methionyl-tRNA formyltransferase
LSSAPRIAFAGTPEFAVPALQALAATGATIPVVLTQPDRPAGRGRQPAVSSVKTAAQTLGLPIAQPEKLTPPARWMGVGAAPDLLVVAAYGLLLPRAMLAWPRLGCVNLHASLLPRWRGASPIQYALLAGDAVTGVSVMRMEAGLDTGPVYAAHATPIEARETAATLHERLATIAAGLLAETLPLILSGALEPVPQRAELATIAPKIAKADAILDWRRCAIRLERQVRAFNPWPVAEGRLTDARRLRIWDAVALHGSQVGTRPGAILNASASGIDVATGAGVLRLTRIQPPSGRAMDAQAYLAAHSLEGASFAG